MQCFILIFLVSFSKIGSKERIGRPIKVEVYQGSNNKNLPASLVLSATNVMDNISISDRADLHTNLMAAMLNSLIGNTVVNSFNLISGLDPWVTLTMKATQTKTIHITEFLPTHIRKKRFPKSYRADAKGRGIPCMQYQEAPVLYKGITIDIWITANFRLLNHLLLTGYLARQDIEYYLAYTAHIFDLAEPVKQYSIIWHVISRAATRTWFFMEHLLSSWNWKHYWRNRLQATVGL